jgi:hypothetical protein
VGASLRGATCLPAAVQFGSKLLRIPVAVFRLCSWLPARCYLCLDSWLQGWDAVTYSHLKRPDGSGRRWYAQPAGCLLAQVCTLNVRACHRGVGARSSLGSLRRPRTSSQRRQRRGSGCGSTRADDRSGARPGCFPPVCICASSSRNVGAVW